MKKYIFISIVIFVILGVINFFRILVEFENYNQSKIDSNKIELETISKEAHKVSDFIYNYKINTPEILDIFEQRDRKKLFETLNTDYKDMKNYGVQQLHFHLPNNDSFLRFHKPKKFGDNLTNIRESVRYVNKVHKKTHGFEEGKIFNGYRYVYPLNKNGTHLGSVEISSSLLNFKKIYERDKNRQVDYILLKSVVENKLFSSELKNYKKYHNLNDFLIQSTIYDYNEKYSRNNKLIDVFLEDKKIESVITNIDEYSFSKFINNKIYTIHFIPLYNDFLNIKVGYSLIFTQSDYLDYFLVSIIGSYFSVLLGSFFIGYIFSLYGKNQKNSMAYNQLYLEYKNLKKDHKFNRSIIDGTDDLIYYKNKDFVYIGCNESFCQIVNKSKEEIIGKTDFDIFPEEYALEMRNFDNMMFKDNEILSHYEYIIDAQKNTIKYHTQRIPLKYDKEHNEFIGILGISRNVSDLEV